MRSGRVPASARAVLSPVPRDLWRDVYDSDPNALAYHAPGWTDLLCSFAGYEDASRLYELPGERLAVLPMVRRRLPGGISIDASFPPAWGSGGLIATGGTREEDVGAAFADLIARPVTRTTLRPDPVLGPIWAAATPRGVAARPRGVAARPRGVAATPRLAHTLDLSGGFDAVWRGRFTASARRHVRKAERSGLSVECDTTGRLVPVFYRLFEQSLDRWAALQHEPRALARWRGHRRDPQSKFEAIARGLEGACRIWLASLDGRPAAGILVIQGRNANYTRGAMDKELAAPTSANYLLHRLAIEDACAAGCRYYHMGESGQFGSLAHFKTRFGAEPRPFAEYHIERVPITAIDRVLRTAVKRTIHFRDAPARPRDRGPRGRALPRHPGAAAG